MAASVKYFDTAKLGFARVTTGVTANDGSGSSTALTWSPSAPSGDWMLTKIIITVSSATGVGDLADSLIHIHVDDGTTQRVWRTIDPGNPAAGSTTLSAYQIEMSFGPEYIFHSGCTLEFSITVTTTAGNVDFIVFAQAA